MNGLSRLCPEKSFADGGFVGNFSVGRAGLGGADDKIGDLFVEFLVINPDLGAEMNGVGRHFLLADYLCDLEHGLKLGNSGFNLGLLVFGLVIFAVFRKVAERKGNLYFLRDLFSFDVFQLVKLVFIVFKTFGSKFDFFDCHCKIFLSKSLRKRSLILIIIFKNTANVKSFKHRRNIGVFCRRTLFIFPFGIVFIFL